MKSRLTAKSRIRTIDEVTDGLKEKGINVNAESLATRVQNRRTIGDLEDSAHLRAKDVLGLSDSEDSDDDVDDDEVLKIEEGEKRGRKGREVEKEGRKLLGKRRRDSSDQDMDVSSGDDDKKIDIDVRGSKGKSARKMTPSQRKTSVHKILRERSQSRREGSEPKRLDYKLVPEE
jgi:hypothetical protein